MSDHTKNALKTITPPVITLDKGSTYYPNRLTNKLGTGAPTLQVQGNTKLLNSSGISFIGAPSANTTTANITQQCVTQAVDQNLTVITNTIEDNNKIAHQDTINKGGNTILIMSKQEHQELTKTDIANKNIDWDRQLIIITQTNEKYPNAQIEQQHKLQTALSQAVIFTHGKTNSQEYHAANTALATDTPLHVLNINAKGQDAITYSANQTLINNPNTQKLGMSPITMQPNMEKINFSISTEISKETYIKTGPETTENVYAEVYKDYEERNFHMTMPQKNTTPQQPAKSNQMEMGR